MTAPFPVEAWDAHGRTVASLLATRAHQAPAMPFLTLLDDAMREEVLTYADLHEGARRMAAGLQALGVGPGDRVIVALPTGRAFLELFFGIQHLGATAVPVYPPVRTKGMEAYQEGLGRLMAAARPKVIVTFKRVRLVIESTAYQSGVTAPVVEADALPKDAAGLNAPVGDGEDVALIQFSSGSTGHPKGVMLPHRALLANVSAAVAVIRPLPTDVTCTWLPLYHDMGLIGMILMPLFSNTRLVLMSPQAFLLDTKRWLWAIHKHRCTISTAPNFAYQLLATRLKDTELEGLDLSCWRLAYNGAEPILPSTMQAVGDRLKPYGFDPEALTGIYGLAEVAVAATFPPRRGTRVDRIDPVRLSTDGVAEASEAPGTLGTYMSAGQALPGYRLRIVGPEGTALGDRQVGEVQLQGPSVMTGYLDDPAATEAAFQDGWLRTGDLGYTVEGELYLVGRLKDMIVKGGRNYAPQDLEAAAAGVAGIRKGCVAAFGVPNQAAGTEAVVVVAETKEPGERHGAVARDVAQLIAEAIGLKPDEVVLVPPGTVPKTSSGKVRRRRCRELYVAGDLTPLAEPRLLDHARLVGQAFAHRLGGKRGKETERHG